MKLTKLTIKKCTKLDKSNYSLFQLEFIGTENAHIIGNKIRRNLLKNTM